LWYCLTRATPGASRRQGAVTGFYLNELLELTKTLLDAGHCYLRYPRSRADVGPQLFARAQYFGNDPKQLEQYQGIRC
jgi:hypothetical protein